jgi:hypothetical protein
MVFLAVKVSGTDVIFVARNNRKLICIALNDVSSGNFNSQKDREDDVFHKENILHFILKCTGYYKYVKFKIAVCAL